jgi:hypothetical protein
MSAEKWTEWIVQYEVQGARSRTTGAVEWHVEETLDLGAKLAREIAAERAANTKTFRNVKIVRRKCEAFEP